MISTDASVFRELRRKRLQKHLAWQRRVLQSQVYWTDSCLLVLLLVVVVLVQLPGYQYQATILSHCWFTINCGLLMVLGFISLLLAWLIGRWEGRVEDPGVAVRGLRFGLGMVLLLVPVVLAFTLFHSLPRFDMHIIIITTCVQVQPLYNDGRKPHFWTKGEHPGASKYWPPGGPGDNSGSCCFEHTS